MSEGDLQPHLKNHLNEILFCSLKILFKNEVRLVLFHVSRYTKKEIIKINSKEHYKLHKNVAKDFVLIPSKKSNFNKIQTLINKYL